MSVSITSTTDSNEAVTAALGNLAETKESKVETAHEQKQKATEHQEETKEAKDTEDHESETDEHDEDHELAAKDETKDEKPKKKGGFQKKIDKLVKEREFWREQALKTAPQAAKPQEQATTQKAETLTTQKPDANKFNTHEEYMEALADWRIEQRLAREKESQRLEAQKEELQKQFTTHKARVEAFQKEHEDFDEVLAEVDDIPASPVIQKAILKSANGPELMYELAKNRSEFERINSLPHDEQVFELGKFAAKLAKSEASTEAKKTTSAPPPLKTIGTKSASSTKRPDEMDFQEFLKWRQADLKKKRG